VTLGEVLSFVVIVDSLLSFVLPPYHPLREGLGRILQPLYAPIRKIIPPMGGMDFSPIVVLVLVQLVVGLLTSLI
jgi:YggT family protein